MNPTREGLDSLPGSEIVLAGITDLEAGRESVDSNAVLMASRRLRAAGVEIPSAEAEPSAASHRLYELLAADDARNAHSRYNAIVGRLVSFARAAERARGR